MNLSRYLARRLAFSQKSSFSRVIVRIAIFTVALSMAVMILASSMINGFKKEISHRVFDYWGHIHVNDIGARRFFDEIPIVSPDSISQAISHIGGVDGSELREDIVPPKGGITGVFGTVYKPGIIRTKTAIEGIVLKGVLDDYDWQFVQPYLKAGRLPSIQKDSVTEDIMISVQTSNRMKLDVGDKMIIHFVKGGKQFRKRFQVCGLYKTGLEEFDKKMAVVDAKRLQDVLKWGREDVSTLEIYIEDLDDLGWYQEYMYYEILPNNLYAQSIDDKFPAIFEWLKLQGNNEGVILILMLVVSIVNMLTSLLILILERTNMIGVLSALGQPIWSIRKIFLFQAFYITLYGLVIGNIIGIGLALLQKHFHILKLDEVHYYLSYAPIQLNIPFIVMLNIIVVIVILLSMILPTYLVNRISPIKAIRFK